MRVTVILPTHNPDPERLRRTLRGLREQTLPPAEWETVIVDNASQPPLSPTAWIGAAPEPLRLIREPRLGLTHARRAGLAAGGAPIVVWVDDDTVLDADYLTQCLHFFDAHPEVGALGGKSQPEFAHPPPPWLEEFHDLLALRDLGSEEHIDLPPRDALHRPCAYPPHAPIGAGLALRRSAADASWSRPGDSTDDLIPDRTGSELTSGGDNDLVFTLYRSGHAVAYSPRLRLTHLIPASRLEPAYLARLNRGIQRSWVRVLARHQACPWPAIPRWTTPLRRLRAYVRSAAWRSPVHRIRWQGLCGRFDGQADLRRFQRKDFP